MCGISGILNLNGEPADANRLWQMVRLLGHRGPDDSGIHVDGAVGLAHARLSIIDLGGGHQPMHNVAGSAWIAFNGEIFNYVELTNELKSKGHRFATQSDTEVILDFLASQGDRMAMAHSVEGRYPFLDHRIIEFSTRVPPHLKMKC